MSERDGGDAGTTTIGKGEVPPPYSMTLVWDPDDAIFVVTVPELAGCQTHGATYEEAARKGREAIASWLDAARAWGDPIPPPRVERHMLDNEDAFATTATTMAPRPARPSSRAAG